MLVNSGVVLFIKLVRLRINLSIHRLSIKFDTYFEIQILILMLPRSDDLFIYSKQKNNTFQQFFNGHPLFHHLFICHFTKEYSSIESFWNNF